jgi:hypothetical protein
MARKMIGFVAATVHVIFLFLVGKVGRLTSQPRVWGTLGQATTGFESWNNQGIRRRADGGLS